MEEKRVQFEAAKEKGEVPPEEELDFLLRRGLSFAPPAERLPPPKRFHYHYRFIISSFHNSPFYFYRSGEAPADHIKEMLLRASGEALEVISEKRVKEKVFLFISSQSHPHFLLFSPQYSPFSPQY